MLLSDIKFRFIRNFESRLYNICNDQSILSLPLYFNLLQQQVSWIL